MASLAVFLGIVWWAYAPAHRERFERDGRMVFDEPEQPETRRGRANEPVQQQLLGRLHRGDHAGVGARLRRVPQDAERAQGRRRGSETTGHTWDEDLGEYNNPLPRWWMWLFYITIVFALVYLALYPGLGS